MKFTQEVLNVCKLLEDKKAEDIVVSDTAKISSVAKFFIIATASSITHTKALADYLEHELEHINLNVVNREGFNYSEWIVLDLDEILVHIFTKQKREYYNLEKLITEGSNTKSYDKIKKSLIKQEKEQKEKLNNQKLKQDKKLKKEKNKTTKTKESVKKTKKIKKDK